MEEDNLKAVEAILFDFEGTLVELQWNLERAVRETSEMLAASGFPVDRLQAKKHSTLMKEATEMASKIGQSPDEVRERIGTIYDRFDEDALTRWALRPEARDLLCRLKAKGIKTGLVSNVGKKTLTKALQKLDLHQLFDVMVTRNDVKTLKPSGEGLNLALNRLQVTKEKALYVGDSLDDIQAAKEAGLKVIVILGGENPRADLLSASPDFLIKNFAELLESLREESS
jgi:HAD superfamily hydrolase (TIGR01549 family)